MVAAVPWIVPWTVNRVSDGATRLPVHIEPSKCITRPSCPHAQTSFAALPQTLNSVRPSAAAGGAIGVQDVPSWWKSAVLGSVPSVLPPTTHTSVGDEPHTP